MLRRSLFPVLDYDFLPSFFHHHFLTLSPPEFTHYLNRQSDIITPPRLLDIPYILLRYGSSRHNSDYTIVALCYNTCYNIGQLKIVLARGQKARPAQENCLCVFCK